MNRAGRRIGLWLTGALLGLATVPVQAQNVQPISTSLAECAVIHHEIAGLRSARRRGAEKEALLREGVRLFREEAVRQAAAEGVADPEAHVAALEPDLAAKWSGRMSSLLKLRENYDWIEYCRALGEDRGIVPLAE